MQVNCNKRQILSPLQKPGFQIIMIICLLSLILLLFQRFPKCPQFLNETDKSYE